MPFYQTSFEPEPLPSTAPRSSLQTPGGNASYWRRLRLLGVLLLGMVVSAAAYFEYLSVHLKTSFARTEALREAAEENRRLLGYALDLESGHRGYLLTSNPRHLESFTAADRAMPEQIIRLEGLLKERPELIAILREMQEMLIVKRRDMERVQASFEAEGRMAVLRSYGQDLGKYEMDGLRRDAQRIETALDRAARDERQEARRLMRAQTIATTTTLLVVAFVGIAALLLGRRHFDALCRQEQLTEELIHSQRRSDVKSAFLAHVSHEIRTPMNAIFGFSSLLHDRLQDPVNRRYIDAITSSARSLLGIINDLLDLSAIEAGKLGVVHRPTNLREVIDSVMALFAPQAAAKDLRLHSTIDPDIPATLVTDGDRIRQMLVNLVGNAVKYSEAGEVHVVVEASVNRATRTLDCSFVVRDTGPGIAHDDLDVIFEPFARGTKPARNRPDGTGLGLSITRQLARAMGGDVTVSSELGRGSTFRLTIPEIAFAGVAAHSAGSEPRLSILAPMRVLIVDDVELNRQVLDAFFSDTAHETRIASSGAQALEIVAQWVPDVVLLDVRMDGINGIEVARRLRAEPRTRAVRIIGVTASRFAPGHPYQELFDGIVLKPFTELVLVQELMQVTGQPAAAIGKTAAVADAGIETVEPELIAELQELLEREWRGICNTVTIAEVRQFADGVLDVAERHGSALLRRYGQSLVTAVSSFDVARMEALLAAFPGKLAELERLAESGVIHESAG